MENLPNMNNLNKKMEVVPGSESWLGGVEMKEIEATGVNHSSENLVEHLAPGVALDGGERFEAPTPQKHFEAMGNEKVIEEIEVIPEHLEKVAKIVLPILKNAISRGAREGWDTATDKPSKLFVETEGADIEKTVKDRAPGWKEAGTVYDLLRSEPFPLQNEREVKMKAALLERASSGKFAH